MVDIQKLRENFEAAWPEVIARDKVEYYTGGLYTTASMASYDTRGCGVPNKIRLANRKVAYPKKDLIEWILARVEAVNAKSGQ